MEDLEIINLLLILLIPSGIFIVANMFLFYGKEFLKEEIGKITLGGVLHFICEVIMESEELDLEVQLAIAYIYLIIQVCILFAIVKSQIDRKKINRKKEVISFESYESKKVEKSFVFCEMCGEKLERTNNFCKTCGNKIYVSYGE